MLAAQCTDVKVNEVTRNLFPKYCSAEDYVAVAIEELEEDIRPTGFYRQKAKNIRATMHTLIERHGGEVPNSMDDLTDLPGIGRKSANVILGNIYSVPGIVVDTHVGSESYRIDRRKRSCESGTRARFAASRREWTAFGQRIVYTVVIYARRVNQGATNVI